MTSSPSIVGNYQLYDRLDTAGVFGVTDPADHDAIIVVEPLEVRGIWSTGFATVENS